MPRQASAASHVCWPRKKQRAGIVLLVFCLPTGVLAFRFMLDSVVTCAKGDFSEYSSPYLGLKAALVINCTGPGAAIGKADEPLLTGLIGQGLIRPDACRLGVEVDEQSRLIDYTGAANPSLFAVGPITRGSFWETTSVPDIRGQVVECAASVLAALDCGDQERPSAR